MKKRWYVVSLGDGGTNNKKSDAVWTVSRNQYGPGWAIDWGTDGDGLKYKHAKELADAANAAWEARKKKAK